MPSVPFCSGGIRCASCLGWLCRPATLRWPDINRRVCRGRFLWAEARAKCFLRRTRRRKKQIGAFSRPSSRELCETLWQNMNCTPLVRQYDILSNKWGVLLLSNFWGSLQFSAVFFIYSPLRRPATEEIGSEKQMAPAGVPGPAFSLMAFMMAAFSSLRATM